MYIILCNETMHCANFVRITFDSRSTARKSHSCAKIARRSNRSPVAVATNALDRAGTGCYKIPVILRTRCSVDVDRQYLVKRHRDAK